MTPRVYSLPALDPGGAELDPYKGFFSFLLPIVQDVTNLVTNPSMETGITGYTGTSATLAQDSTYARRGLYALKVTPTANVSYASYSVALVSGTTYHFSLDVLAPAGLPLSLVVATSGDSFLTTTNFVGTGLWQRVVITYIETANATRHVILYQNNANRRPFWTDGWMVQSANRTLRYIDGDQKGCVRGRNDYYWNGTPHASTSTAIGQCRWNGYTVPLSDYGFRLTQIIGLGEAGRQNQTLSLPRGGAAYYNTVYTDRQFVLAGVVYADSLSELQRKREGLIEALRDDTVYPSQPLKLLYQLWDDDRNQLSTEYEITCISEGDPLAGKTDSRYGESLALTFRLLTSYTAQETGEAASVLSFTANVANANRIMLRPADGVWSALGTGMNGLVAALAIGSDKKIYAGGSFTSAGGVANTNAIAYWDGVQWNAMGTGIAVAGIVLAIVVGPDGSIYVGGVFTGAGGVANTAGIARWDGAWHALGTGVGSGGVSTLAFGLDGTLYAGGSFGSMGGVADTAKIAKWDGSVWTAMGAGVTSVGGVGAMAVDRAGGLYVGGDFTNMDGRAAPGWSYWIRSSWVYIPIGVTGSTAAVYAIAITPSGQVYFGGDFTTVALTKPAANIASVRLSPSLASANFSAVGDGTNAPVFSLASDLNGLLYIGGGFTVAGGLSTLSGLVTLVNNAGSAVYVPAEITLPSSAAAYALLSTADGRMVVGFSDGGVAVVPAVNTINNISTINTGVKLIVTGPGILWRLVNLTTGNALYFNLTLQAGEVATLDMNDPTNINFTSTFQGNILNTIIGGSTPANFSLAPGPNSIIFFMTGTTGASGIALLWRNTQRSIDGIQVTRLNL